MSPVLHWGRRNLTCGLLFCTEMHSISWRHLLSLKPPQPQLPLRPQLPRAHFSQQLPPPRLPAADPTSLLCLRQGNQQHQWAFLTTPSCSSCLLRFRTFDSCGPCPHVSLCLLSDWCSLSVASAGHFHRDSSLQCAPCDRSAINAIEDHHPPRLRLSGLWRGGCYEPA